MRGNQRDPKEATEALFAEYGDRIYRFCFRLCGRAADAEDLTQEVFLAAFQGWKRFQRRSSVATWLYRIALYRWYRLRDSRMQAPLSLEEGVTLPSVPDPAPAEVERFALEAALKALPEELRAAFLLVKAEGLKYREAAEVLDIPQGTVQFRVHEATLRLRAVLSACQAEPALLPLVSERESLSSRSYTPEPESRPLRLPSALKEVSPDVL